MGQRKDDYMRGYADGYRDAVAGIEQVASELIAAKSAPSKPEAPTEEHFSYTERADARGRITREPEDSGDWR